MRNTSCGYGVVAVVFLFYGCGAGEGIAPPPAPSAIAIVSGSGQTGSAGAALPERVTARVTAASGAGLEGIEVVFVAVGGGSVSEVNVTTGADGLASTVWTLGTVAGASLDTLRASVSLLDDPAVFTATVTAAAAVSLTSVSGDSQSGHAGQPLAQLLVVVARDQYGNARSKVDVLWSVTSGGGSLSHSTGTTGLDGTASVSWTPGNSGPNVVQAVVAGLTGSPVSFVASLPVIPPQLSAVSGNNQTGAPGQLLSQPLVAVLRNQAGDGVAGADVTWSVISGGGVISQSTASTNQEGQSSVLWTLGSLQGAQRVTASVDGATASPVSFVATAVEVGGTAVVKVSGDDQRGVPGTELGELLVVRVHDLQDNPVTNRPVTWEIGVGGGSVAPENTATNGRGEASARWTLGPTSGANRVHAVVSGVGSVTFSAMASESGGPGFDIAVRFLVTLTPTQRQAFSDAAGRWESVIAGDLPDVPLIAAPGTCGKASPAINELVDDLLILVTVEDIDGPGGILGQAGPCYARTVQGLPLPHLGMMRFDVADLQSLESVGSLKDVILHEMGHVLGIGSFWDRHGLLSGAGTTDPFFNGTHAIGAFDDIGGIAYTLGEKVPVENIGPAGTIEVHWRESVFADELMTGVLSGSRRALSIVTIQSLRDQGYTINPAQADHYTLTMAPISVRAGPMLPLGDDRLRVPLRLVDPQGRVTRTLSSR